MNREEILQNANIPQDIWDRCYISDCGQIFTSYKDKTGEEVYQEWLKNKDKETVENPSKIEELETEVQALKAENSEITYALMMGGLM